MENKNHSQPSSMTLVGKKILHDFMRKHTDASKWIGNWIADVEGSVWRVPQDITSKYPSASFLANNVVIFNVKGNSYRLEVKVAYQYSLITIRWIGTHGEYDKRNKERTKENKGG